ncbi:related to Meiotically up-regulated gene 157 protein [Phialocephala subalpina]|uniref:Related to Meiotically up-regulated gene 157 protein n=1 Tax=Phialocephala subalpina TaxID=576137 RepID=A0A1L7X7D5_9HELO|nr:related to Meiotically up-regulated gene 157 protein [Phialocephala subalpina]
MGLQKLLLGFAAASTLVMKGASGQCPDYSTFSQQKHEPYSTGKYQLSYMRPQPACRTFNSSAVEQTLTDMQSVIKDPDLYRLFYNSFPNTLDTAVKWKGFAANNSAEELTFLITGDINAMWLRDSANQMQSYLSLLTANSSYDSIASLYRGVINLQARYINEAPFCNSFQPPVESGLPAEQNQATPDNFTPREPNSTVFECKYELDSLAAFLEISTNYYETTGDIEFFRKFQWVDAINTIIEVTESLLIGTYASNGSVNTIPYTWQRQTTSGTETLDNNGRGNPVQSGTGLVRSAFRPSDDATIYQLFIPANMMFSRYLDSTSSIMANIGSQRNLANHMHNFAGSIRDAITKYGIVNDPTYGQVYAFEVDGFGSANRMDDANIPSLLSAPFFGYLNVTDPIYQNTRKFVLSKDNGYFMRGPVISAVGGPHVSFGQAWPMASIIRIFTSSDTSEIEGQLKEIVSSTDGLGLIHESIDSFDSGTWTRQWFSWANGLFGQCLLDLKDRGFTGVLGASYQ